jgi:N-acetylglucosaminyldiphosphoundecaprenol N-acetyl-beta-D-mannosaminyltransferase
MINLGKKNLLGIGIDAVDYESAVERFMRAAHDGVRYTTTALAVHGVMTGALDKEHRFRLNALDMIVPDGMPVRWGLNLIHKAGLPDRVYGPNLMLKICEAAAQQQLPIFLFGTSQETLDLLAKNLKAKFPSLQIAGAEHVRGLGMSASRDLGLRNGGSIENATIRGGCGLPFSCRYTTPSPFVDAALGVRMVVSIDERAETPLAKVLVSQSCLFVSAGATVVAPQDV